ncbi:MULTISPECIES: protein-disulfide reductase DsbD [unclassified Acinetobacter]|uniref:protein-disulfide reductase DsbD n=1 Tax=unclassified Acinetobacter TaxID=196816 RepID=UPI0029352C93|nr:MULTISPECIES: protein-disulfide reductase DsbD [unclassified Acinetobacter]WOE33201.1 protein-disulfide reductase DsbD [Acinetobacter sp. SAAs470]WOE39862.1 protein-disulfide reductase DsbD [Acinetobacter sp. SAAs474]
MLLLNLLQINSAYADFLPPDQAFRFKAVSISSDRAELSWQIAEGYYLYQDQFKASSQQQVIRLNLPAAQDKDDPNFGQTKVYYHHVKTTIPVQPNQQLNIQWQGCAESGLCYPLQRKMLQVDADGLLPEQQSTENHQLLAKLTAPASSSLTLAHDQLPVDTAPSKALSQTTVAAALPPATVPASASHDQDQQQSSAASQATTAIQADITNKVQSQAIASSAMALESQWNNDQFFLNLLSQQNLIVNLLIFLALGILLAFLPCSLPLIPIISGILVQGKRGYRAALIAGTFVFGMAAVYAVMGFAVAQLGYSFQRWFQSPFFIGIFAFLFLLFAINLFGVFQLSLPQRLLHRLDFWQQKQQGGTLLGALLMGMIAALIVGPCMSAPLAGALLFVAQLNTPLMGASYLFILGIGIGLPLFIAAVFGAQYLPKPGRWMDRLKFSFGFMMLALAVYFIRPLLPMTLYFILMASILLLFAAYCLGYLLRQVQSWISKLFILLVVIVSVCCGGWHIVQAIQQINVTQADQHLEWIKVNKATVLRQILAQHPDQAVVIDVYADWCVACQPIEREVLPRADVQAVLSDVVRIKLDLTNYDVSQDQLLKDWQILGPPTMIFLDTQHQEQRDLRLTGTFNAAQLIARLQQLKLKQP